ncbi:hypothetical protein SPRG_16156 [Saprolegnia parasitica CBS 223.65]|uniref:Uncharacterized protein n=1 Tax=Saprolegnia parasitica (strain CBS 223.65) TaxID=695850 RepID=A0A067BNP9_SAPPC|nr:hypothetical protein SPRG_16156 [Saprolegnia parasitica CBS 223.65]KDO18375.1 hypothetical protein SPRG_16156 [Saprolegnia parasitica CBS 223.65]|eukprot:XP_012210917.1 hypothetical protein SPRG_16156 [Saprolegnia parasitica CBS 223.65]
MPRVADSSQQPTRRYAVKCNYVGLFLSTCSLLNIASMPMKAYISEYLPWRAPPVMPDMFSNFSDFSAHMLAFDKRLYNNATLPQGATYVTDWTNDVQVMRQVLYPSVLAPLAPEACLGSFLLGMPGLIFYTPAQMDLLCSLVATTNASELYFPPGACFANALSSRNVGTSCYWIDHGNTLTNATEPDAVTLTYVYNATRYYKWLWCKFAYRILSTCFVIYRLWTQYYRHCLWLHRRLARASHFATPPTTNWRYELVLGDPTAIILMDPMVALVFLVDIWISIGNVGVAVLRASQNGDVTVNLLNILYLSRTVWFGYFALCLTAFCLRRYSKQHLFADVDTTMVAIGVTVYGPLISWLSGNVAALAAAYQWCFTAPVPADKTSQQNELALGC